MAPGKVSSNSSTKVARENTKRKRKQTHGVVLFARRLCPTFVQGFDAAGHGAIKRLNECWTRKRTPKQTPYTRLCWFAGRSGPTFFQVFDGAGDGAGAIENLKERARRDTCSKSTGAKGGPNGGDRVPLNPITYILVYLRALYFSYSNGYTCGSQTRSYQPRGR